MGGNVETFNFLYSHLFSLPFTPTPAPTTTHDSSKHVAEIAGLSGAACAVVALLVAGGIYYRRHKAASIARSSVNGEDTLLPKADKLGPDSRDADHEVLPSSSTKDTQH